MHVSEAVVATGVAVGQAFVIDAEEVKDGGLKIVNGNYVLSNIVAQFITLTMNHATFHSSTGQPRTINP